MKHKLITVSLVTHYGHGKPGSLLKTRLAELKKLELEEISLFLTGAKRAARAYVKKELAKTRVNSIPHIHLRDDMTEAEAAHYIDNYGTTRLTTHYEYRKHFLKWSPRIRKMIGIENNFDLISLKDIDKFAGIVIDLSHCAYHKYHYPKLFAFTEKAVNEFPVIVNHLSGLKAAGEDTHFLTAPRQLDYLSGLAKKFIAPVVSLELGNTFNAQFRYLEKIKKII